MKDGNLQRLPTTWFQLYGRLQKNQTMETMKMAAIGRDCKFVDGKNE